MLVVGEVARQRANSFITLIENRFSQVVSRYVALLLALLSYMGRVTGISVDFRKQSLPESVLQIVTLTVSFWWHAVSRAVYAYLQILYFLWVSIPWKLAMYSLSVGVFVITRKSVSVRRLQKHFEVLWVIVADFVTKMFSKSAGEVFADSYQTINELFSSIFSLDSINALNFTKSESMLSFTNLYELLSYEEYDFDADDHEDRDTQRRSSQSDDAVSSDGCYFVSPPLVMYSSVPMNPFKATLRLNRRPKKSAQRKFSLLMPSLSYFGIASGSNDEDNEFEGNDGDDDEHSRASSYDSGYNSLNDDDLGDDSYGIGYDMRKVHTPTSVPSTPFSRARVMNRSSERVESVIYTARDWLRLEAQQLCSDEYSRQAAIEASRGGTHVTPSTAERHLGGLHKKLAVFDSTPLSLDDAQGELQFACGGHCVYATEQIPSAGLDQRIVSSCRSMLEIGVGVQTYFDFSVEVSHPDNLIFDVWLGLSVSSEFLKNKQSSRLPVGMYPGSLAIRSDGMVFLEGNSVGSISFPVSSDVATLVSFHIFIPSSSSSSLASSECFGGGEDVNSQPRVLVSLYIDGQWQNISTVLSHLINTSKSIYDENNDENISHARIADLFMTQAVFPTISVVSHNLIGAISGFDSIVSPQPESDIPSHFKSTAVTTSTSASATSTIRIWSGFSEADVDASITRETIFPNTSKHSQWDSLLLNERVYCLDGSILFY